MEYPAEYLCPICKQALQKTSNSYQCPNSHNFDIAKQGYINLLPVQQKKSKNPGDNKIMIEARQSFLNKGYYDILIKPCIAMIEKHSPTPRKLLDIGCGEGYFTHHIFSSFEFLHAYGLDISKDAIKIAAKRNKTIHWLVASSKDIPLAQHSLDVIVKINAPAKVENLSPYLTDQGILISVTPGPNHLDGLKQYLYDMPKLHDPEPSAENHVLLDQKLVQCNLTLSNRDDIKNLFLMTPFAWNATHEVREKIENLTKLDTNIAFQINVWQKQQDLT